MRKLAWALVMLCALGLAAAELLSGSYAISPDKALAALFGEAPESVEASVMLEFRLPRLVAAAFGGAALCVGGLIAQTLFKNPLAGPDVMGVNAGASLGVALVMLGAGSSAGEILPRLGIAGSGGLIAAASLGGALVLLAALALAGRSRGRASLLVVGLLLGFIASSAVTWLVSLASPERVKAYASWSAGSFAALGPEEAPVFMMVAALAIVASLFFSRRFDALLLGERYAASLGFRPRVARAAAISLASVLAGLTTAFCGPVSFIGVAMPHAARALAGTERHAAALPAAALVGATAALAADLVTKIPGFGSSLPLNAVTSMIGAPVVLFIVLRGDKAEASR